MSELDGFPWDADIAFADEFADLARRLWVLGFHDAALQLLEEGITISGGTALAGAPRLVSVPSGSGTPALGFASTETYQAPGAVTAGFDVPFSRAALYATTRAGALVTEVDGVTRERIQDLLARTLGPAYANPAVSDVDLASALRAEFEQMSSWRADMIARTETAYAAAHGAIDAYKEAGVTEVEISDGDDWDEPCQTADGQTWTLADYEANPLEHPNCTRAASPIVTAESRSEVSV